MSSSIFSWHDIAEDAVVHCCVSNGMRCGGVTSRVYVGLLLLVEQRTCFRR